MQDWYDLNELVNNPSLSPMMKNYVEYCVKYPDFVICFRCGDFFECYVNSAIIVAGALGLKVSEKSCGLEEKVPMCGFPVRATTIHFNRILQSGYKIVVVDQVEDPKNAVGRLVHREITQMLTRGTITEDEFLQSTSNNYLASIFKDNERIGFSYVDVSTGEVYASSFDVQTLKEELSRVKPSEMILLDEDLRLQLTSLITRYQIYVDENFDDIDENILKQYFTTQYLKDLSMPMTAVKSLEQLLSYVYYTQKKIAKNINTINFYDVAETMIMDGFTRNSLELTKKLNTNEKQGSLYSILDMTKTAMGSRKLRQRIEQPFVDKKTIEKQLDIVEELHDDMVLTGNLRKLLNNVYDIERICGRLAFERINPKEMIQLKNSVKNIPEIKNEIFNANVPHLQEFVSKIDLLDDIYDLLERAIDDNPNNGITEGGIIKTGYDETVDKYRDILSHISEKIDKLREEEKKKWGTTAKILQNEADGYYLEITKKTLTSIVLPNDYQKLKELSNNVRFMFPALKAVQSDKFEAMAKNNALENQLYCKVRDDLIENIDRIKNTAIKLAELDVALSFAKVAVLNNYKKPILNEKNILRIKNGRHPVIEATLKKKFIANDLYMNPDEYIHLITGANMSGKSTFMRQCALIILMAQIGSFVPADEANISICDRIYTRIGASDNLSEGESTFMVEMNELSEILNNSSHRSFLILDEIGRGTSTWDGMAIFRSTVEYIANRLHCFTLLSTHYFELIDLENKFTSVKNYKLDVIENGNKVEFLRKVVKGYSTKSYGVYIAEMAGIPKEVVDNARNILNELENGNLQELPIETIENKSNSPSIEDLIEFIDIQNTTPLEALQHLSDLKKIIEQKKNK